MDFRDNHGRPLPSWQDAESAFEAWKKCSAGRPCDYTGLSYAKLRDHNGIQWPCNSDHPDGHRAPLHPRGFGRSPDYCETYGKDLVTGAPVEAGEYRARNPDGKAMIKAAEYLVPHEPPTPQHPFALITGRTLYHFHTRTKTARTPQLQTAAARHVGRTIADRRGSRSASARATSSRLRTARGCAASPRPASARIRRGVVFVPFHYGYFDADPADGASPRGQRTHTHRLGSGVQTADLQDRRRPGITGSGSGRRSQSRAHDHRLGADPMRRPVHRGWARRRGDRATTPSDRVHGEAQSGCCNSYTTAKHALARRAATPWPRATAATTASTTSHETWRHGRAITSATIADVGRDYGLDPDASPVVTAHTAPLVERFSDLLGQAARIGHAPAGRPARRALPGCRVCRWTGSCWPRPRRLPRTLGYTSWHSAAIRRRCDRCGGPHAMLQELAPQTLLS